MSDSQVKALLHRARKGFKRSWVGSAGHALLPVGLFNRFRRVFQVGREPVAQVATPGADIGASAAHMAASCSGVLQQCAQFFGERLTPAFTAVFVGAASYGAVSTVNSQPPTREPAVAAVATSASEAAPPRDPAASRVSVAKKDSGASPQSEGGGENAPASAPAPAPSNTPTSTPSPTPGSAGKSGTGQEGSEAQDFKPVPSSQSASEEPSGFSLRVGSDLPVERGPCSCLKATDVSTESVHATKEGLQTLTQSLEGSAEAAGVDTYGLSLSQEIGHPSQQRLSFLLYTEEGSYRYTGAGSLTSKVATSWGGWTYRYEGYYELGGRASKSERVPENGRYVAEVTISWRYERVVSMDLSLFESEQT